MRRPVVKRQSERRYPQPQALNCPPIRGNSRYPSPIGLGFSLDIVLVEVVTRDLSKDGGEFIVGVEADDNPSTIPASRDIDLRAERSLERSLD